MRDVVGSLTYHVSLLNLDMEIDFKYRF